MNGKPVGKRKVKACRAVFKVQYVPGTVTAVAYDRNGREAGRSELVSAAGPLKIRVRPEKAEVKPGEVVYVPVNIEGSNDVVESNADRKLTVTVDGGELLAFGSANPCTEEQYHSGSFTTYYGRFLAVVRVGKTGIVKVRATGGGMIGEGTITVRE